jgi:hypothetical protein
VPPGRSTVLTQGLIAEWLIDLLGKLGREDDAYDAVGLVIPSWGQEGELPEDPTAEADDKNVLAEAGLVPMEADDNEPADIPKEQLGGLLEKLPTVRLITDRVPPELDLGSFFRTLINRVLLNSPVNFHKGARQRRADALAAQASRYEDRPATDR